MGLSIDRRAAAFGSTVVAAVWLFAGSAAAQQPDASAAEAVVRELHRALIDASRRAPHDLEARYGALHPVIVATHDLPYIAEFAVRRQWPELRAADRERFVAAFEKLSVRTYASRFTGVDEQTFRMDAPAAALGDRVTITAAIAGAEGDITLEYLLHERDGAWRIINIIADGVSDLALKRAEYQRVLGAGSIDDLIAYLEEQTARLQ